MSKVLIVYLLIGLFMAAIALLFGPEFQKVWVSMAAVFSLGGILFHVTMKKLRLLWPESSSSIFFLWVMIVAVLSLGFLV